MIFPLPKLTSVFKSASIYVTGQNLLTLTHYSVMIPRSTPIPIHPAIITSLNTDYNPYPNVRTWLAGVRFGF